MRSGIRSVLVSWIVLVAGSLGFAEAGGAWVPAPGEGNLQVGGSRKTADTSWNADGESVENSGRFENHDFRYGYLQGEVGVVRRLSFNFLVTYLYGLEGPDGHLEKNAGPSDSWLSLKYAVRQGDLPMAVELEVRTPVLYDIDGPYSRNLYDEDGNFLGHSPEWRGLLKHDVTLSYLVSRSRYPARGWWSAAAGYTWREGAPADQVPIEGEYGWGIRWRGSYVKLAGLAVLSLGNESEREPGDRFGAGPGFNDASMARLGVSLLTPLDARRRWMLEIGYNQWVWGESARQYKEPFLSLGWSL